MSLTELLSQARKNNAFGVRVTDAQRGDAGLLELKSVMMFEFASEIEIAIVGYYLSEDRSTGACRDSGAFHVASFGAYQAGSCDF